jgi:hypothetical protein
MEQPTLACEDDKQQIGERDARCLVCPRLRVPVCGLGTGYCRNRQVWGCDYVRALALAATYPPNGPTRYLIDPLAAS